MQEKNYNRVISEVKTLKLSEQLRLLEEIAAMIRQRSPVESARSIMELRGKGKDIWSGIDVGKYLDEERSSWNG